MILQMQANESNRLALKQRQLITQSVILQIGGESGAKGRVIKLGLLQFADERVHGPGVLSGGATKFTGRHGVAPCVPLTLTANRRTGANCRRY